MKRIFALLFGSTLAAALLVPMSISVSVAGVSGQQNVAYAACAKDQVTLSVPLLNGKTCLDNSSANGGVIVEYVKEILQVVSAGVGGVIMLLLVIGGIQYITSLDDPGQVKAARDRIVNALTALVLFALGFAILSFVIPGGILS